ncbi:MAG: hypothetical protein OXI17_03110 [Gammaproteobacteria bacterium]|nr:hypothetical protein [Gammaproteobacteria bacterium]
MHAVDDGFPAQVANASMGLSTPTAIYQARFAKYLENRGLKPKLGGKVWCFIGDGYGLCETRSDLRNWFEVSADYYICHAALVGLFRAGKIDAAELAAKAAELDMDPDKMDAAER